MERRAKTPDLNPIEISWIGLNRRVREWPVGFFVVN
jgi:hypothetical protein